MLHCIERIDDYTKGQSFEEFQLDGKTMDAVVRNIQIMGEAAIRMPGDFKEAHSQIEWTKIIRTRHILTHEYDDVDNSVLWRIMTLYLPPLKNNLQEILKII
jgi:uncharacterized protein with HEPN domain